MTGICTSIRMQSKRCSEAIARALAPSPAVTTSRPRCSSMRRATSRFTSLSSTSSTRPLNWPTVTDSAGAPACRVGRVRRRRLRVKQLPCPCSLIRVRSPPRICASRRAITRPRPVPPWRRDGDESSCENAWNSLPRSASAMPTPVSRTSMARSMVCSCWYITLTCTRMPPWSVNFTALEIRLLRICRRRTGSEHTSRSARQSAPSRFR